MNRSISVYIEKTDKKRLIFSSKNKMNKLKKMLILNKINYKFFEGKISIIEIDLEEFEKKIKIKENLYIQSSLFNE